MQRREGVSWCTFAVMLTYSTLQSAAGLYACGRVRMWAFKGINYKEVPIVTEQTYRRSNFCQRGFTSLLNSVTHSTQTHFCGLAARMYRRFSFKAFLLSTSSSQGSLGKLKLVSLALSSLHPFLQPSIVRKQHTNTRNWGAHHCVCPVSRCCLTVYRVELAHTQVEH